MVFSIKDKINKEDNILIPAKESLGDYETYICFEDSIASCQNNNFNAIDYSFIQVNGRNLYGGAGSSNKILTFSSDGEKGMYYYTKDSSSNLEVIKHTTFRINQGDTEPRLAKVYGSGAGYINGYTIYTNTNDLEIVLYFLEDSYDNFVYAKLYRDENPDALEGAYYSPDFTGGQAASVDLRIWEEKRDGHSKVYLRPVSGSLNLPEGNYTLDIYAKYAYNELPTEQRKVSIKINRQITDPLINVDADFYNGDIPVSKQSNGGIDVVFERLANVSSIKLDGQEIADQFNGFGNYRTSFSTTVSGLELLDGPKTFSVEAEDYYSNSQTH
jgi:hypothetical protein